MSNIMLATLSRRESSFGLAFLMALLSYLIASEDALNAPFEHQPPESVI